MNKDEADRRLDNLIRNGLTREKIEARVEAALSEQNDDGMVYLVVLRFKDADGVSDAYWSYKHECDIYERVAGVFDSEESLQQALETQLHLKVGETRLGGRLVLSGYVLVMSFNRFSQGHWVRDL